MAPLNPTSRPYSNDPIPSSEADLNFWPDRPTLFSHNSKTNMSSLRSPTIMTFPDPLSPPTDLSFRPPSQATAFAALDAVYNKTEHPMLASQGTRCGGYNEKEDESRNKDALKTLEKHIKDRTPYVQLASARLQAVSGIRNDSAFDLPELPKRNLSPSIRALYDMPKEGSDKFSKSGTDKGGMKAKSASRIAGGIARIGSGVGSIPKTPLGMQAVDNETGKGLREFLLQKGKECGMRKRQCKNISFHDFTPDMRTGNHKNLLLGHYAAEKGDRVDVYEVDLPTTQIHADTGEEFPATETWIWILISRPMVSYDPTDPSTKVPAQSASLTSPSSDIFFTPCSTASPEPAIIHPTPPNFPHPTPLSWLVFAAPKAHITSYPEAIENLETPSSPYPFAGTSKNVEKRIDYDFSFSGVPIFEFSSADMFSHTSKRTEFLSIEQMGGWYENDPFQEYTKEEYKRMYSLWEDGEWGSRSGTAADEGFDDEGNPKASMPAPNRGFWWNVFYQRMHEDCARWENVKKAMGRGKCRVVVRWNERAGGEDVEMVIGGAVDGKQGLGLGGKKVAQGKRLTRSETRRCSGLGLNDPSSGVQIGVGGSGAALSETIKSRAAGNRELGRVAGAVDEKEKKIRKR